MILALKSQNYRKVIEHATEGWAPEDYMGVLHTTKNVNRGFQLAVGSNGIYARRLHSSLTDAPWQTLWTDANFTPSSKADKTYVDQQLGDVGAILDAINGV